MAIVTARHNMWEVREKTFDGLSKKGKGICCLSKTHVHTLIFRIDGLNIG